MSYKKPEAGPVSEKYVTEAETGMTFRCREQFRDGVWSVRLILMNELTLDGSCVVALPFRVPAGACHEVVD